MNNKFEAFLPLNIEKREFIIEMVSVTYTILINMHISIYSCTSKHDVF